MTTVNGDDVKGRRPPSTGGIGVGSPRYWLWSSGLWCTVVAGTAVVAAAQIATIAIAGMVVAGVCGVLVCPDEPPVGSSAHESSPRAPQGVPQQSTPERKA